MPDDADPLSPGARQEALRRAVANVSPGADVDKMREAASTEMDRLRASMKDLTGGLSVASMPRIAPRLYPTA